MLVRPPAQCGVGSGFVRIFKRFWRLRFISAFLAIAFFTCCLAANPAQNPKRLVNNLPVDLTPLFKWWARHDGPRPLTAWSRVTGTIVGTNSGAWIIEGKVERTRASDSKREESGTGSEPLKILLRNPPLDDAAEFQRLTSRLTELNKQRAILVAEENQAKSRDQAITQQQRASRRNRATARVLAAEDKQLKQAETQAKTQQKPLDQEIQEIKTKLASYPKADQYVVDCFALDLQSEYGRMAVYDHGRTMK